MESILQVWEIVTGLLLKVNGLYYKQLILFDSAYWIQKSLGSRCNFRIPVVKKAFFGLSSYRAKEEPVRVLSSLFISFQCNFVLIVPPLLRLSSDCNFLYISSLVVSKKPRDYLRE